MIVLSMRNVCYKAFSNHRNDYKYTMPFLGVYTLSPTYIHIELKFADCSEPLDTMYSGTKKLWLLWTAFTLDSQIYTTT